MSAPELCLDKQKGAVTMLSSHTWEQGLPRHPPPSQQPSLSASHRKWLLRQVKVETCIACYFWKFPACMILSTFGFNRVMSR